LVMSRDDKLATGVMVVVSMSQPMTVSGGSRQSKCSRESHHACGDY